MAILFDEYLGRKDFAKELRALADPVASKLGLPPQVDEIGLVCPNALTTARRLEKQYPGMRTFIVGEGSPRVFIENNIATKFTTRVAFGFYRGVILEIAEPGLGSTIFSQSSAGDQLVVNHVGFLARGPELRREDDGRGYAEIMGEAGYEKRVEAILDVFGFLGHVHIFDTGADASGIGVEFLDFRLFSARGPAVSLPVRLLAAFGWFQKLIHWKYVSLGSAHELPPAP